MTQLEQLFIDQGCNPSDVELLSNYDLICYNGDCPAIDTLSVQDIKGQYYHGLASIGDLWNSEQELESYIPYPKIFKAVNSIKAIVG